MREQRVKRQCEAKCWERAGKGGSALPVHMGRKIGPFFIQRNKNGEKNGKE